MSDDDSTKHAAKLAAEDDVPKLPRGRGIRLSGVQLVRIAGTAAVLVVLLLMQRPCSRAVSTFVTSFDGRGATGSAGSGGAGSSGSAARDAGAATVPRAEIAAPAGAGSAAPSAPNVDDRAKGIDGYEHLEPGMTNDEVKAAIERARVKASQQRRP